MINLEKVKCEDIKNNISLKNFSSFKIGGNAKYFYEAKTILGLKKTLNWAIKNKIKYFILGGGSNVLFSDNGFDGLVIRLNFNKIKAVGKKIYTESGANLGLIVGTALKNRLVGIEDLSGIPGTFGGAVRGNAGIKTCWIGDKIESAKIFDVTKNKIITFQKKDFKFGYRESILKKYKTLILISAILKLKRIKDITSATSRVKELALKRVKSQPHELSAGCIFMNPTKKYKGKATSAGELIDKAGLKGKRLGNAEISNIHANFFINKGNASSMDMLALIDLAKSEVYKKFKIRLVEEIEIV
ncbi:MAG: UDP-N-acetylmuramate dehydrogenase [Candidatus Gracilibacteria bacterium]